MLRVVMETIRVVLLSRVVVVKHLVLMGGGAWLCL